MTAQLLYAFPVMFMRQRYVLSAAMKVQSEVVLDYKEISPKTNINIIYMFSISHLVLFTGRPGQPQASGMDG